MRREGKKWGKRSNHTLRYCDHCKLQSKRAYYCHIRQTNYTHYTYAVPFQDLEFSLNKRKRWEITKLKPKHTKKNRDKYRVKGYVNWRGLRYGDYNAKKYIKKYKSRPDFLLYPKYHMFSCDDPDQIDIIENFLSGSPHQRTKLDNLCPSSDPLKDDENTFHIAFCESEHLIPESYGYLQNDMQQGALYSCIWGGSGDRVAFYWLNSKSHKYRDRNFIFVLEPGKRGRLFTCPRANQKPSGFSTIGRHRYSRDQFNGCDDYKYRRRDLKEKDKAMHKMKKHNRNLKRVLQTCLTDNRIWAY